jgi:hypothetical protein
MKILILKPRLDVTFKKGPVPANKGGFPPIRTHWENFVNRVEAEHMNRGDEVEVLELPLWQFTPEMVFDKDPDISYIPHKERHNFDAGLSCWYYMQTVFPWLFTVDQEGWGGGAILKPTPEAGSSGSDMWDVWRRRIALNESKFDQPAKKIVPWKDYVFFPCQIPHDETIKYHSKVHVHDALQATVDYCAERGKHLVVKGHPVNPGSMTRLQAICNASEGVTWVNNFSIHDLLANAALVVTVNSGTGLEAIIHDKTVVTFGDSEYDAVANKATLDNFPKVCDNATHDLNTYRAFIDAFGKWTYDTSGRNFSKLPGSAEVLRKVMTI